MARGDALLQRDRERESELTSAGHTDDMGEKERRRYSHSLGLVEVVGPSVVDIVAERCGHHGEGIQIRVVLPQPPGLQAKR